jgi:phospholipase/carboxylesterase
MLTGAREQAARSLANGLEEARDRVSQFLDELQSRFHIPTERIVLGGFSQGSIVSLEIALTAERHFAALWLMSTTMLSEERLKTQAARTVGMPALISHGRQDPILPFGVAESMVAHLKAAEWDVHWLPFSGGHGVPAQVIAAAANLLPTWLS